MDWLMINLLQVPKKIQIMLDIIHSVCSSLLIFLGTSVGEGTFGKVKLGKHILTGEKVSLKI